MKLVITGDDLDQSRRAFPEYREVTQQVEKTPPLEHALDQGGHLRRTLWLNMLTVRSAPRHEALLVSRQRADPRRQTIRGHQQCVAAKQCRDLLLVGLKLIESACQGGALSPGGFELNNGQRQPVDEQHNVWSSLHLSGNYRKLLHCQPVVVARLLKVDQAHAACCEHAVITIIFNLRAIDQQAMDSAVLFQQVRQFRLRQAAYGVCLCFGRQRWVQARHRITQPAFQHDFIIGITLRLTAVRAYDLICCAGKAEGGQLLKQCGFQLGFGEKGHHVFPPPLPICFSNACRTSPMT